MRPCSSPVHSAKISVRFGLTLFAASRRATSIVTAEPDALSSAPLKITPLLTPVWSRWPPVITYWAFNAGSVPSIFAMTLRPKLFLYCSP